MEPLNLSPASLFLQAGPVGKTVIVLLGIASVWCWFQIFEGLVGLFRLRRALTHARQIGRISLMSPVIAAGVTARADILANETAGELRHRMMEAMNRDARILIARLEGGLPNLAVIASVAPFVGLFGTVWGIMVSFTAIAASNDTSLAVVAPGIAEALATTAFGLVAAIPASIGYSRLGAAFGAASQDVAGFIEETSVSLLRMRTSDGI